MQPGLPFFVNNTPSGISEQILWLVKNSGLNFSAQHHQALQEDQPTHTVENDDDIEFYQRELSQDELSRLTYDHITHSWNFQILKRK